MPRPAPRSSSALRFAGVICAVITVALLASPMIAGALGTRAWSSGPVTVEALSVVRQRGEYDCGPALVATLAAWRGRGVSLDHVVSRARMGAEGVTLGEFARLATAYGLAGTWYSVRESLLTSLDTPFVAHLASGEAGHYVAVVALDGGFAVVADPARGALAGPARVLLRHYSGRAFLLEDAPSPRWEGA